MHKELLAAGKTSQYFEYKGLEHNLADSTVRAEMLESIATFVAAATK